MVVSSLVNVRPIHPVKSIPRKFFGYPTIPIPSILPSNGVGFNGRCLLNNVLFVRFSN